MRFEWDPAKNGSNQRKHGVTFEEAQTAFLDDAGLWLPDPDHSDQESRFVLLGRSAAFRLLVVCHTFRDDDQTLRIISARQANAWERRQYDLRFRR
jgi:uncharacterized DUF497 family protein